MVDSMAGVTAEVVILTPEKAQYYLDHVSVRRTIYKTTVNTYAKEMERNNWQLNGESIVISDKGNLLNGRHRCSASVKTGLPFVTIIVYGIDEDTFYTIDAGKSRTDKDLIYKDVTYPTEYASALRLFAIHSKGKIIRTQGCSLRSQLLPKEHLDEYEKRIGIDLNLRRSVVNSYRIHNNTVPKDSIIPRSCMALMHYYISTDPNGGVEIADAFARKVYSRYDIEYGDPIGAFRNTIESFIINPKTKDVRSTGEGIRFLFYAWRKFVNGEDYVKSISLSYIDKYIPYEHINTKVSLYIDERGKLQRK